MSVTDTFSLQLAKVFAALAILIYDYFITLHSEGRKWGIIHIVFTVSRYVPFAGSFMTSYCMHFLGIVASEGLLIARVYAFSGNKKAYRIILLSFGLAVLATSVILSAIHSDSVNPPCAFEGTRSSAFPYGLLMLFEIVLMCTTVFLRYRHYLDSPGKLVKAVYKDGLLYMFCIMLISTVNVIIIAVLPLSYSEILNLPQIVAHSVLASRILFNLQVTRDRQAISTYQGSFAMETLSTQPEFRAWSRGDDPLVGAGHPDQA
ncbi:hypothetical protein DFH29DRAFT_958552 [Suillus ampliporus]|nr:hypothetical protein DFH29DRAFT_958552 [Suillus ampliporus]